jgi:FlaA1/EpsC-like NDP-sugar epimerase
VKSLHGRKAVLRELSALSRPWKRAILVAADTVLIAFAIGLAVLLKYGSLPAALRVEHVIVYAGTVFFTVFAFVRLGLYRAVVRYIGPRALRTVFIGVVASASFLYLFGAIAGRGYVNLSFVTIYALIAFLWVSASRFTAKWIITRDAAKEGEVAVIYGAGEPGIRLARALDPGREIAVVAFIDDKLGLTDAVIDGLPVRPSHELPRLIEKNRVTHVLLAIPSASRRRRAEIIQRLERLNVAVHTIPNLAEIASGAARVDDLREVDVADILGRDPVPPNLRLLDACIRGKNVMVTGAGGSIGSELCRQILRLGPLRLVLFDRSELALYNIERELRRVVDEDRLDVELVALLGNSREKRRVREVIDSYAIQTLYHAAAYKHVPIVEQNVIEGIRNNVFTTWYTAEAAMECQVETFVLISTDKAVNPTNVMGATKRLAEMVLQCMQERGSDTRFCMVRFGNVLESSGSVVPLFREQIRRGGPVTVTHPEVMRYFMTIPEASQLVLQAGSMGQGSDVFVLDMGKPMRIDDLARRMINLSGLSVRDEMHPEGDIEIVYTGLRPAEKLFEELLIGNNVSGTDHPMIMRAMEHSLPWSALQRLLQQLMLAMTQFDVHAARELLIQGVSEYKPSEGIADLVWRTQQAEAVPARAQDSNVTSIQSRRGANLQ